MWHLDLEKLRARLAAYGAFPSIAIETGTCRGNGTRALSRAFARVHTIELSAELHAAARERLTGAEFEHVRFHRGNSADVLPRLLGALAGADDRHPPLFYFLDAHWSGDHSVDWNASEWKGYGIDTAHSASDSPVGPPPALAQCPLLDEIRAIARGPRGRAFVLIDDLENLPPEGPGLRNRGFMGEDWSHLSRAAILNEIAPRLTATEEWRDPAQWLLVLD